VSEFVEECRREWRRLGVADAVANEMAADLAADLQEAEAEGASAEEVLGSGAFDPRAFAASWARERGVIQPQPPAPTGAVRGDRSAKRPVVLAAVAFVAIVGAALVLSVHRSGVVRQVVAAPFSRALGAPVGPPGLEIRPAPLAGVLALHVNGPDETLHGIALILLVLGVAGLLLAALHWSPRRRLDG
jgi:hypothetical protein